MASRCSQRCRGAENPQNSRDLDTNKDYDTGGMRWSVINDPKRTTPAQERTTPLPRARWVPGAPRRRTRMAVTDRDELWEVQCQ